MAIVSRKSATTGSEHWLRIAISDHAERLDAALRRAFVLSNDTSIEWLSPIASDRFSEYRDDCFLQRLGINPPRVPLSRFWPKNGPQWDGLGRTSDGKLILVEAKAYLGEVADDSTKASNSRAKALIHDSLLRAQEYFVDRKDVLWTNTYYQYVNRLAHIYFLRHLNGIDAYLVFLNFADAPDRKRPASVEDWITHGDAVRAKLGLPNGGTAHVAEIIWSVPEMLRDEPPHNLPTGQ